MAGPGGQEVGRVSVRVVPNTEGFRSRLRQDLERETAGIEARVPINIDLDTAGVSTRMRALMAQLRAQAAGGVDVNVGLDRNGVAGLSQSFRGLSSGASGASGSMRGLTQNIFIMLAVMALIGPLVTLVGGLLAGLPSLLLGFGAAAAAVALGFDGIKKAAAGFSAPIAALKESLSARFEDRLTPIFDKLAGSLPKFEGGLLRVADGVSDLVGSFTDVVTSAAGVKQINTILKGTGSLFSQLKPFVRDFSSGLLGLGSAGASSFTYLSSTMRNFSSKFNEVVQRVTSDGSFYAAMKGLSQVADGLGDAFNVVFEAAIRSMPKLGETLKVVLQQFGIGLADAMPGLVAFGNLVFGVIGFASRVLGGFFKGVGPALTRFADGMTSSLQRSGDAVSDVFERIGMKFGEFLDWLREKTPMILNFVGDFFKALSGGDPKNPDGAGATIGTNIREFFTWIKNFWDENGEQIIAGVGALAGAITGAGPMIAQFVGYFISAASFIGSAKDRLTEFKDAIAGYVGGNIENASQVMRRLSEAFGLVKQKVGEALGAVANFVSQIPGQLQSAGQTVINSIQTAWSTAVATIRQKISEAVSAVGELGGKIASALAGLPGQMLTIGTQIVQGLINGITSKIGDAVSAARDLAGKVAGAIGSALSIGSPSRLTHQYGRWTAEGLINGIDEKSEDAGKSGEQLGKSVAEGLRKQVPTMDQAWSDALKEAKIGEIPQKFFEATGNELLSDIGISTDGALGELVKQVTNYNPTYIVQDLDEAQRKEKNKQRKDSLQHTRR